MKVLKGLFVVFYLIMASSAIAWNNGPAGNASTDEVSECSQPPYATHDWVADHALDFLPEGEKAWLLPHKRLYLLGTEAPDNAKIPSECGAPNTGYDDRRLGHSVEWNAKGSKMIQDRAAIRAQEEYNKAVIAYEQGRFSDAAFYLGAMAHYVGDVSAYPHAIALEQYHSPYESWVRTRTDSYSEGVFESYLVLDRLSRRTPYAAVKTISKATSQGNKRIMSGVMMDQTYPDKKDHPGFLDSVGHSLNLGVNELADVLHTFYFNVVQSQE